MITLLYWQRIIEPSSKWDEADMTPLTAKPIGAKEKVNHNIGRFWGEIIKEINGIAEEKKLDIRLPVSLNHIRFP